MIRSDATGGKILLATKGYEHLLRFAFALVPTLGIVYLHFFQDPSLGFEHHLLHEAAITVAVALSAFIAYVTWRCYQSSGEPFLRWLTVGFAGFAAVYAPHGVLTRFAHDNLALFLLYGPASRLVMGALFFFALLHYGRETDPPQRRTVRGFWLRWAAIFVAIDLLVAAVALSPLSASPWVRIALEGGAIAAFVAGIAVMHFRRIGSSLMLMYTLSLAAFTQSSVSFFLGAPWNHQWWYAHLVFAAGFFILSYGVVRAFHTTRTFYGVYSQEEMMQRLAESKQRAEEAVQQLAQANGELRRLAATDPLTGAANRRHFWDRTLAEISRSERSGAPLALLALDLDHFKKVNDRHGHQHGDEVLKAVVHAVSATVRPIDLVGRLGGEEFIVLLPDADIAHGAAIAERIRRAVEAMEVCLAEACLKVTISIGAAQFGRDGASIDEVLSAADERLYRAKSLGRNRVVMEAAPPAETLGGRAAQGV